MPRLKFVATMIVSLLAGLGVGMLLRIIAGMMGVH